MPYEEALCRRALPCLREDCLGFAGKRTCPGRGDAEEEHQEDVWQEGTAGFPAATTRCVLHAHLALQGDKVVNMNIAGVDAAIEGIIAVKIPASWADLSAGEEAPVLPLMPFCVVMG